MNSLKALQGVLKSNDWHSLTQRLQDYVENLSYKVVPARSGFQM
jgi:hypothetical protein